MAMKTSVYKKHDNKGFSKGAVDASWVSGGLKITIKLQWVVLWLLASVASEVTIKSFTPKKHWPGSPYLFSARNVVANSFSKGQLKCC